MYIICSFIFHDILFMVHNKFTVRIKHAPKQTNLFLIFCKLFVIRSVYLLPIMQWEMAKNESFNTLPVSHSSHFNFRWLCFISDLLFAVALSSVQLLWSLLFIASWGTFVLNTVSIIGHYIYSKRQGMYWCEVCSDLQTIVQYHCTELAYNFVILSRQFQIPFKTVTYRVYMHTADMVKYSDTWYWTVQIIFHFHLPQILNIYTHHYLQ
jgi:hypothetical protein